MATSHFTSVNQITLHHLAWEGADPPLVFLPGFISNAHAAQCLGDALSPQRRVLALDLRGRGQSDKPEGAYGFEQHLSDIRAWLERQQIERCILAGHSFGAGLALFFADRYPNLISRLILLDGGTVPSKEALQIFIWYHTNLTYQYPSLEAYLAPYREMITLQPWTDTAEQLVCANVTEQPDGTAVRTVPDYVVQAELSQLTEESWGKLVEIYPRLPMPTLLIRAGMGSFGRDDQHITTEVLQKMNIPHLQVYEMPDTGHTGILTVPDPIRDQVLRDFVMKD